MSGRKVSATTQISKAMKQDFFAAIKDEYSGASEFFRRRINEKCTVERARDETQAKEDIKGFESLNVSVTPEQRAALLAQCEKEGKTMGTWMRDEIKNYLEEKQKAKKQ